jgi:hypothetical protein
MNKKEVRDSEISRNYLIRKKGLYLSRLILKMSHKHQDKAKSQVIGRRKAHGSGKADLNPDSRVALETRRKK